MAQSKIAVTVGNVSFSGEGEPEWLAEQLERVLAVAPQIVSTQLVGRAPFDDSGDREFTASLAGYIKEKGGENSQVDRFLVAADWLRRHGLDKLTTGDVSRALKENHQKRLANPADCLNKNVSKGFCEKSDGGFFITPDGLRKLGHS